MSGVNVGFQPMEFGKKIFERRGLAPNHFLHCAVVVAQGGFNARRRNKSDGTGPGRVFVRPTLPEEPVGESNDVFRKLRVAERVGADGSIRPIRAAVWRKTARRSDSGRARKRSIAMSGITPEGRCV